MTRAKRRLTISRAIYRRSWGNAELTPAAPSRFLAEIPAEMVEAAAGSLSAPGETRRYEPDPDFYNAEYRRPGKYARGGGGKFGSRGGSAARTKRTTNPLIGTRVRHPTYGVGTILKVEDDGDDRRITVSFVDHGMKKLIERYAHLEAM